ncbi:MAG: hypothetical protein RBR15_11445 [Sphaerochaeta sp.]|nr:hypothetical protein [Sphaerochaeta sp.]
MQRRAFPWLVVMILIFFPLSFLGATSEMYATYVQEPSLQFTQGSGPYTPDKLVGLIGTLTLTTTNPPVSLKEPSVIVVNTSGQYRFRGKRWYNGYLTNDAGFYLDSVTSMNGETTTRKNPINHQVVILSHDSETWHNVTSLQVRFYFVSDNPSSTFVPGETYALVSGTIGSFYLAMATPSYNINTIQDYIPVNGQIIPPLPNPPKPGSLSLPSASAIPFIGAGSTSSLPPVPYADSQPPQELQYLLSIIEEHAVHLPNAYGTNKTPVATAKIDLVNAVSGKNYKVDINFTSKSVKKDTFYLHLDGKLNLYGISYALYFNDSPVTPGKNIRWKKLLKEGEKQISVTGVIQDNAESAPSGNYSDTVAVNITAVDT